MNFEAPFQKSRDTESNKELEFAASMYGSRKL